MRHYHDKPPSAPAEEGNIDMMRLLGVRPIDIISTTIMTTTLNGSLPAGSQVRRERKEIETAAIQKIEGNSALQSRERSICCSAD